MLAAAGILEFFFVPANVVLSIIYPAAVAACLWSRNVRFLWFTTLFAVTLSACVQHSGLHPPLMDMEQVMLINRLASVATTLIVAVFVHRGILTQDFAETQWHSVERKNRELENLNQELGRREEEIVRQNEELRSQTEELERQTEELRVTNEELANWERRLEQLLELARSLTADTGRSEVFTRICETVVSVADAKRWSLSPTPTRRRCWSASVMRCRSNVTTASVPRARRRNRSLSASRSRRRSWRWVKPDMSRTSGCGLTCRFRSRRPGRNSARSWRPHCASKGGRSEPSRRMDPRLASGRPPRWQ
jgi:hypothetical protein